MGAVAQMGERIPRTDEAVGSIPICTTSKNNNLRALLAHLGCAHRAICASLCQLAIVFQELGFFYLGYKL